MAAPSRGSGACARIAAVLAAAFAVHTAHAASFPCQQAKSRTEVMICSDAALSAMDDELNAVYRRQLEAAGDKAFLRTWQRGWLKARVAPCGGAACVKQAYAERIALLKALAPAGSPAAQWNGHYVRYWQGKPDRHGADITLAGMANGAVHVVGSATWLGPNAQEGQVHTGELEGEARPRRDALRYDSDGCSATLRRKNGILAIDDETGCGGHNVTFNGEYRKQ